jgi:hypothetical protein
MEARGAAGLGRFFQGAIWEGENWREKGTRRGVSWSWNDLLQPQPLRPGVENLTLRYPLGLKDRELWLDLGATAQLAFEVGFFLAGEFRFEGLLAFVDEVLVTLGVEEWVGGGVGFHAGVFF